METIGVCNCFDMEILEGASIQGQFFFPWKKAGKRGEEEVNSSQSGKECIECQDIPWRSIQKQQQQQSQETMFFFFFFLTLQRRRHV